jgi:hypothetical protein
LENGGGVTEVMEKIEMDNKTVWVVEKTPHSDRIVYYDKAHKTYYLSASAEIRDDSFTWETVISEDEANLAIANHASFKKLLTSSREWQVIKPWQGGSYIKNGKLGPEDGFLNTGQGQPW